jgi:putative endonuclease
MSPLAAILMADSAMTIARQELGKSGEDLGVETLERAGYAILERRYRTRHGEIDIIARDGEAIVFVEVRRRSGGECGSAAESVTPAKRRKVIRMAVDYLARADLWDKCPVRFDVVAIDDEPGGATRVTLYKAAFDAST